MAWKQDLAKLKQQLAPEPASPIPKAPKPAPKNTAPAPMEDEDAVFMAAMGLKRAAPPTPPKVEGPQGSATQPSTPPAKAPETFDEALRDLKGFKPLAKGFPDLAQAKAALPKAVVPLAPAPETLLPPPQAPPIESPAPVPEPIVPIPAPTLKAPLAPPAPPALATAPLQFNLAAGMALEVDAALDLRGHSLGDALERLKDRLGDGRLLGWRVLQVTLGSDPILHEGLLALLGSGKLSAVTRFARAPVPMGGNEAWLLYFAPPPPPPESGRMEPPS